MAEFGGNIHKTLRSLAMKVGSNRALRTISAAYEMVMPMIFLGGIFALLDNLDIEAYQIFIAATGIKPFLSLPSKFTVDLLSLYLAFTAGYSYINVEGNRADGITSGLVSLVCFFIVIPINCLAVHGNMTAGRQTGYLGSKGLLTALAVGILVGMCYESGKKALAAKVPDDFPASIENAINTLIPGTFAIGFFLTVHGLIQANGAGVIVQRIYDTILRLFQDMGSSLVVYCLLIFVSDVLWFLGIHGAQVTMPVFLLLFMAAGADNQSALSAGQPPQNIITMGLVAYLTLGGAGVTIGLAMLMRFFSKSERYRTLGKMAILPSLCNINEPILFGMPIISNPLMAVPFFALPQAAILLTYGAMRLGLVAPPRLAAGVPGMPFLLDGFLMCGISGAVWQAVLAAITFAGYYPFFRIQDETAYREEQ